MLIAGKTDAMSCRDWRDRTTPIETAAEDGFHQPARLAPVLHTSGDELARTVGLGREAPNRADRVRSPRTQRRLREMVEILTRVEPRFGAALLAFAWSRAEPLAGLSGMTAMQLVHEGQAAEVTAHIDPVDAGVHA